jgi:hypothetical protein
MAMSVQKRRFRFSLRMLLLAPVAAAIFVVLFNPRIITGHFCYITIDRLEVTDSGGLSVGYSRIATPGTVETLRFPHSSASSASSGGGFTWHVRGTASGGGGVDLRRLGLAASDWHDAILVEAGKTYRIDLGERLVLYSVQDVRTGKRHEAYIDFQKYPRPGIACRQVR